MFPLSDLPRPRCVALRSKHDNSYLRCVHDESQGGSVFKLTSGGDGGGGVDHEPALQVLPGGLKEHDGYLHVRCCYNNKYWAPQQPVPGGSARWIIGTAHEPKEDLSKPSCTLFKHIPVAGEDDSTRFLHSKLGKCVGVLSSSAGVLSGSNMVKCSYLHIAHEEADHDNYLVDAFQFLDLSEQKMLPSSVAFKGDNGYFLDAKTIEGHNYLEFSQDINDPSVIHSTFTNGHGVIRIKSNYFDRFWIRLSSNWIWADTNDPTYNNRDTLFNVTNIGHGFVALKNLGNNNFCERITMEGKTDCLNAFLGSVTNGARLQVYELVISRDIYDVDFHFHEAKIYTTHVEGLTSQSAENETSTTNKTTLVFTYTNSVKSTWSSTVSMKINIKANLKACVPFIVDGKFEVNSEISKSYSWGNTETEQRQISKGIDISVPPMKKVTVKGTGTNGVCDIPFSYKQKDILVNGQEVIQRFTDGLYFGVKTSEVTFHTKEEDL